MEVPINLIRPSANPIRQTRDEKKIRELAQSIEIHGILQPIKLRPIIDITECPEHGFSCIENTEIFLPDKFCPKCDNILRAIWVDEDGTRFPVFEIVYGARRFEAAFLIGLETVTATIEYLSDSRARLEALIENIQREDMSDLETANGIEELCQALYLKGIFDITREEREKIYNDVSLSEKQINRYINMLKPGRIGLVAEFYKEDPTVLDVKTKSEYIVNKIPNDLELQKAVARKVVHEELGQNKTQKLAEAVAAAPSEQAKKKLLEWEYSPTIHDPELIKERAKIHGAHDPIYRDDKPSPQKEWDDSPQVKMIIDAFRIAIKSFLDLMREMQNLAQIGKLAPEGKQFMIHRLRSFRNDIDQMIAELEDSNG